MRLIDADTIVFTHAIARSIDDGHNWNELCVTKDEIDDMPSVDPERKKGEWIYDGKRGRFPACKCSICGYYENADWALLQGANYCPNCGADMRDDHERFD